MHRKLLVVSLLAGLSVGLNACSEGEYNDLQCDAATYKPECLDTMNLMECQNGALIVTQCQAGYYCKIAAAADGTGNTASCAPAAPNNNVIPSCNHDTPICLNATQLETCVNGQPSVESCPNGCDNNACKASAGCTDGEQKCENNTAYTCSGGNWDAGTPCANGCEGNVCKTTTGCTDSCKDENTLLKCNADGTTTEEPCANGCENNACKVVEGCTDSCKDENTLLKCNEDGTTTEEPCANGCENNACKQVTETCTNEATRCANNVYESCVDNGWKQLMTCEFGCNMGNCIDYKPTGGNEGDKCDYYEYVESCKDNKVLYCDEDDDGNEVIIAQECDADAPCAVRAADAFGYCSAACQEGDAPTILCDKDTDGTEYSTVFTCEKTIDGGYAMFPEQYLICKDGCTDGTGCNGVVTEGGEDGDLCYVTNYTEACEGNKVVYCEDGEGVTRIECEGGASCGVRKADQYADCVESCKAGDPDIIRCEEDLFGGVYSTVYSCAETTDGNYAYFAAESSACVGVCKNDIGCTAPEECKVSDYVEKCESNSAYYCDEESGIVAASTCDEKAPCQIRKSNNTANCAEACKEGDEPKEQCSSFLGMNIYIKSLCEETADGKFAAFTDYEFCEEDCASGKGCIPYEKCDDKQYEETCDNNVVKFCSKGVVKKLDCAEDELTCMIRDEDNYADCVQTCTEGTEETIKCVELDDGIYAMHTSCDKTKDGTFGLFIDAEHCEDACKEGVGCDAE